MFLQKALLLQVMSMRTDICSCYNSTARKRVFGENSECNQEVP